jgi:hypothetical protein
MPHNNLKERVAELERQVAELRAELARVSQTPVKDWRRTIGMFSGDEVMKRIDEHARKFREADRRKARRRWAKARNASKRKITA